MSSPRFWAPFGGQKDINIEDFENMMKHPMDRKTCLLFAACVFSEPSEEPMALFRQIPLGVPFGHESKTKPTKTTHSAPAILLNVSDTHHHFPQQEQAYRCLARTCQKQVANAIQIQTSQQPSR